MPVLYSETCVTTQENTIIMTMTPVTAEMYLMVVFTLSADGSAWNLGEINGPEGSILVQLQAACL